MSGGLPKNLKGYHLQKERRMGFLRKLILIILVVMALLYFVRKPWFDLIIEYVFNLF